MRIIYKQKLITLAEALNKRLNDKDYQTQMLFAYFSIIIKTKTDKNKRY